MDTDEQTMTDITRVIRKMADKWPSNIVCRKAIGQFTGGAIHLGAMQNLDNKGKGPDGAFRMGRNIVYPVDSLCDWLIKRATKK